MSKCLLQVSKHFIRWKHKAHNCAPSGGAGERPLCQGGSQVIFEKHSSAWPLVPAVAFSSPPGPPGRSLWRRGEEITKGAFVLGMMEGKAAWNLCLSGEVCLISPPLYSPFVLSKLDMKKASSLIRMRRLVLPSSLLLVQRQNHWVLKARET